MRILLDTHVLIRWYVDSPDLPSAQRRLLERIEASGGAVGISAITLWEIAKLVERRRLHLTVALDELLAQVESDPLFEVLPLTARVAVESTRLGPRFPKDPADQLIAATARCHGLKLMTSDVRIRRSNVVAIA